MNAKILLPLLAAAILGGCASTKKASNNPADVYGTANVNTSGTSEYENYVNDNDDEYLRMKVQNNSLWSSIDDDDYWYDSRYDFGYSCDPSRMALINSMGFGYGYGFNSMFGYGMGYGFGWTNWYSPYQTIVFYRSPTVYFTTPGNKGGTTTTPLAPTKAVAKNGLTAYSPFRYTASNGNARYITARPSGNSSTGSASRSFTAPRSYTNLPSSSSFGSSRSSGGGFSGGGARVGGGGMGHH